LINEDIDLKKASMKKFVTSEAPNIEFKIQVKKKQKNLENWYYHKVVLAKINKEKIKRFKKQLYSSFTIL
jgi:hypothetical protein